MAAMMFTQIRLCKQEEIESLALHVGALGDGLFSTGKKQIKAPEHAETDCRVNNDRQAKDEKKIFAPSQVTHFVG